MSQPIETRQTNETEGLSGAGPHVAPYALSVPATLTGHIVAALIVHDEALPQTIDSLRLDVAYKIRFSGGAIVHKAITEDAYEHPDWAGKAATVDFAVDQGDVVVLFDGVIGANVVAAATVARMVET